MNVIPCPNSRFRNTFGLPQSRGALTRTTKPTSHLPYRGFQALTAYEPLRNVFRRQAHSPAEQNTTKISSKPPGSKQSKPQAEQAASNTYRATQPVCHHCKRTQAAHPEQPDHSTHSASFTHRHFTITQSKPGRAKPSQARQSKQASNRQSKPQATQAEQHNQCATTASTASSPPRAARPLGSLS